MIKIYEMDKCVKIILYNFLLLFVCWVLLPLSGEEQERENNGRPDLSSLEQCNLSIMLIKSLEKEAEKNLNKWVYQIRKSEKIF